jgi:hypothetical protein
MGLGGNVFEWEETSFFLNNGSGSSSRGIRGSYWHFGSDYLLSSTRNIGSDPSGEGSSVGFRVASLPSSATAVPEPSMMVIGTLFGLGGLMAKRRMKK